MHAFFHVLNLRNSGCLSCSLMKLTNFKSNIEIYYKQPYEVSVIV